MGMGKTLISLLVIKGLLEMRSDDKVIVVVPAAVVHNWGSEVIKFFEYSLPYLICDEEDPAISFATVPFLRFMIISYEVNIQIIIFIVFSNNYILGYCS